MHYNMSYNNDLINKTYPWGGVDKVELHFI